MDCMYMDYMWTVHGLIYMDCTLTYTWSVRGLYSPQGCKELDMTEQLSLSSSLSIYLLIDM